MTLGRAITEQSLSDSHSIFGGHDALAHYLNSLLRDGSAFTKSSRPAAPGAFGSFRVLPSSEERITTGGNRRTLWQRVHLCCELTELWDNTTDWQRKNKTHTASDRVVYLAVAPPIEPVIYSKEIFIPGDLILMIINRPRPLSVLLSGVYSRSWRLKLICTVSPCRFSGHIPRHLQRKKQRQRVAGSECTWVYTVGYS